MERGFSVLIPSQTQILESDFQSRLCHLTLGNFQISCMMLNKLLNVSVLEFSVSKRENRSVYSVSSLWLSNEMIDVTFLERHSARGSSSVNATILLELCTKHADLTFLLYLITNPHFLNATPLSLPMQQQCKNSTLQIQPPGT